MAAPINDRPVPLERIRLPIWERRVRLNPLTHRVSYRWKPCHRQNSCIMVCVYFAGMIGYSFSLVWRIVGLAKDVFCFVGALAAFLTAWPIARLCWRVWQVEIEDKIKTRSFVMLGSIAEVFNAIVGTLCPPLAYYLDEKILSNQVIANHLFLINPWKMDHEEMGALAANRAANAPPAAAIDHIAGPPQADPFPPLLPINDLPPQAEAADQKAPESVLDNKILRDAFRRGRDAVPDFCYLAEQLPQAYALGIADLLFDELPNNNIGNLLDQLVDTMTNQGNRLATRPLLEATRVVMRFLNKETLLNYMKVSFGLANIPLPPLKEAQQNYDAAFTWITKMGNHFAHEPSFIRAFFWGKGEL